MTPLGWVWPNLERLLVVSPAISPRDISETKVKVTVSGRTTKTSAYTTVACVSFRLSQIEITMRSVTSVLARQHVASESEMCVH